MELISQHTKKIMEECKERALDAGLKFDSNTLEYVVTNRDFIELSPKGMIPTLYDYWMHDIGVLQGEGKYKIQPHNPYETVINSRPAISFYNDNNPDWLNVMIFYHVLGHIDFFQNNIFFKHTGDSDFVGKALSDKRLISKLRGEQGRWVDYVIEFSRSIDNLVGYYGELNEFQGSKKKDISQVDYYFDIFLQDVKKVSQQEYLKELSNHNEALKKSSNIGESMFFSEVKTKYPEFNSLFKKYKKEKSPKPKDVMQFIMDNSEFINKNENQWMKSVMQIVRDTSIYFAPQGRTKIFNEGWASYWHEKLFLADKRMSTHEVDFAKINARVTALPRMGVNPYAVGLRLLSYLEGVGDKGRDCWEFQKLTDVEARKNFNKKTNKGVDFLFKLRENLNDFSLINNFVDQGFIDKYELFVTGSKLGFNKQTQEYVMQYFIKNRKAEDYKKLLLEELYHPPHITVEKETKKGPLYLKHHFEGKPLHEKFIKNTMVGIEYLWGGPVKLETKSFEEGEFYKVLYTMKDKIFSGEYLQNGTI